MSTFGKPVQLPRWAETVAEVEDANLTEPPSGQKDTGWTLSQVPPSAFENWRANRTYKWLAWIDERIFDLNAVGGAEQDSIRIAAPGAGDLSFIAGDEGVAGEGGDICKRN